VLTVLAVEIPTEGAANNFSILPTFQFFLDIAKATW